MSATIIRKGQPLPAPRLQLRWELNAGERSREYGLLCHYELVLPLEAGDIRRDVYDDDGEVISKTNQAVIPMKPPQMRGGSNMTPCLHEGKYYCDTPYRDGVHAILDAAHLGNPPIYAIALDGTAILYEPKS